MHTIQRLVVLTVLLVALVPLSTSALLDQGERHEAAEKLNQAIERVVGQYRNRPRGTQVDEEKVQEAHLEIEKLAQKKNDVQIKLDSKSETIQELKDQFNIDITDKKLKEVFLSQDEGYFFRIVRDREIANAIPCSIRSQILISYGVLQGSDIRDRILRDKETRLITLLAQAKESLAKQKALEEKLDAINKEYAQAERDLELAKSGVIIGGGRNNEAKRVMEEVHAQVMRLQSELARIDARLRRKAERKLIEKGLMAPKTGEHSQGIVPFTPQFTWPAFGRISAEFMAPSYQKFFGIPHKGMDIVIPQGSSVVSAADGVVFLTKNGGSSGYSYILVGHRGGYATLYGHLTHISVHAGQDISAGAIVGASGGQPGTQGAGPITTGPHLHFEVIQGGVNVNPRSVLP